MECTITHNGLNESLTFPLIDEVGSPVFSVDVGKPELQIYENGELQPRFNDTRSGIENYNVVTQFRGPDAYADAIQLADMVKSRQGGGEELTVSIDGNNLPSAYPTTETLVAPSAGSDSALSLTYAPGRKDVVDVELGLTRVNQVRGSSDQPAQTPTATGSGPIEISKGASSVTFSSGLAVSRQLGRPDSSTRSSPQDHPNYTDQRKTATDTFEFEFQLFRDNESKVNALASEIIQPQLGRTPITLDFNGLFNLGEFSVVPPGSQALRYQRVAGQNGIENVTNLTLRRVIDQ